MTKWQDRFDRLLKAMSQGAPRRSEKQANVAAQNEPQEPKATKTTAE